MIDLDQDLFSFFKRFTWASRSANLIFFVGYFLQWSADGGDASAGDHDGDHDGDCDGVCDGNGCNGDSLDGGDDHAW